MRIFCLLGFILFLISHTPSLAQGESAHRTTTDQSSPIPPDFLTRNLDHTMSPAKDFFTYANGGWIKRTPIPAEESAWGIGQLVQQDIYHRLRKISEDAAAGSAPMGSVTQQIGDLWYSGMDSATIDRQGLAHQTEGA